jgi:hypothetical protein
MTLAIACVEFRQSTLRTHQVTQPLSPLATSHRSLQLAQALIVMRSCRGDSSESTLQLLFGPESRVARRDRPPLTRQARSHRMRPYCACVAVHRASGSVFFPDQSRIRVHRSFYSVHCRLRERLGIHLRAVPLSPKLELRRKRGSVAYQKRSHSRPLCDSQTDARQQFEKVSPSPGCRIQAFQAIYC